MLAFYPTPPSKLQRIGLIHANLPIFILNGADVVAAPASPCLGLFHHYRYSLGRLHLAGSNSNPHHDRQRRTRSVPQFLTAWPAVALPSGYLLWDAHTISIHVAPSHGARCPFTGYWILSIGKCRTRSAEPIPGNYRPQVCHFERKINLTTLLILE